jgi:hypothetical protein
MTKRLSHEIGFRVEPSTHATLKAIAHDRGEDVSSFVRHAVLLEVARLGFIASDQTKALGLENPTFERIQEELARRKRFERARNELGQELGRIPEGTNLDAATFLTLEEAMRRKEARQTTKWTIIIALMAFIATTIEAIIFKFY